VAPAAGAATVPPWTIQPTQNPGTFNTLGGVSCASATACAAAGDFSNPGFRELPEIWDGISWQVPSLVKGDPLGSAKNSLLAAASCPAVTTCEMVGNDQIGTSNVILPLAVVWNGKLGQPSVASQPAADPPGAGATRLTGVSCTSVNACIAVGYYTDSKGGLHTLAEHFDGSRWQIQPSGTTSGVFNAVSCTSPAFCVAVGENGPTELAYVFNGRAWVFSLGSNVNGARFSQLNGVSCTADGACIAVGQSISGNSGETLTLGMQFTRRQWFPLNTTNPGTLNVLNAVSCTSSGNCMAVGRFLDPRVRGGGPRTLAEQWDGVNWSFEVTPDPGGTQPGLNGVSCSSATTCTAVGVFRTGGTFQTFQTLAERFVSAGSPHGFSLTSKGTVLALLRKPRTLELLVFQRGRHGHLLGPVPIGSHRRGLSRIRWNLRVGGRKLRAGTYTAELVAVFGRGVTSDGPSVTFDLNRAGMVRTVSAACSVTAAERGRC
jgi:hypothetical protein